MGYVLQYAPSAATLRQFGEKSPQWNDKIYIFLRVLYATNFMSPFNWMQEFSGNNRAVMQDASLLDTADAETVRKLLIAHVRADRFCEGHLNAIIRDGYLERALNRLRALNVSP
nr:DUF6508 domain-containing protein [Pseudomonas akapageensis]